MSTLWGARIPRQTMVEWIAVVADWLRPICQRMHRELLAWGWHGRPGLCGPYFLPAMDKTAYKTQLTYPVANTAKDGGRCCQPFGRSTIVWGAGKEYPVRGEDFAFMLFRKRNCCVGY